MRVLYKTSVPVFKRSEFQVAAHNEAYDTFMTGLMTLS